MRRGVDATAILSIVALICFGVFAWTRRVDVDACQRYEKELRSLLALDFRLTAEVMKARAGLVAHYDGIVQTEAARKRLHARLRELPKGLEAGDARELKTRLTAGERARGQSAVLVERFKRENAVLRNSLRFLAVLAGELEDGAAGPPAELVEATRNLVRDELLSQTWQEPAVTASIDRALARLERASVSDLSAAGLAREVVLHARIVRERTPALYELTRRIVAADDAGKTQATSATFLRAQQAALQIADADTSTLFALALVALSSAAASIILRLRHSAAELRRSGELLSDAVQSLKVEQAKQKELSDLKSRFVSMASHEFRTPLSVIMSSSELLEAYGERWSQTKKQEHFSRIHQAALGMTRMLEAILMIGRRDAGLLKFEPRPLEMTRFCRDVLDGIDAATGQSQRIVYQGLPREEHVLADATLLRHALENLLSNALKYSPQEASVEFRVTRKNGELCFEVSDHGIGIAEEDQRHLFETFHRGKNVGEISGTGLGLAIVRGAVELHGGRVEVRSQLNVGTQFTLHIPCTRSEL